MRLHSAYDPQKEVHQFINTLNITNRVLVLIDGQGYLGRELALRFPESKILQIFMTKENLHESIWCSEWTWSPESGTTFRTFLDHCLDPIDFFELLWIVWPPARRIYGPEIFSLETELSNFLKREQGSFLTFRRFGQRWLLNALKNLTNPGPWIALEKGSQNIVIAASGPSLQFSIDLLKENRNLFQLWALPSSLDALFAHNLIPDLVINTDGSHYAFQNLFPMALRSIPLVQSLTSIPSHGLGGPRIFINQGYTFEKTLWQRAKYKIYNVPPQGTVAATALNLALQTTSGSVILAGLDFAWYRGNAHARPHTWDRTHGLELDRFDTEESVKSARLWNEAEIQLGQDWRSNPALEIYSQFFKIWNLDFTRVFRLFPSPYDFPWMKILNADDFKQVASRGFDTTVFQITNNRPSKSDAIDLVTSWEQELSNSHLFNLIKAHKVDSGAWYFLAGAQACRQFRESGEETKLRLVLEEFLLKAKEVVK